MPPVTLQSLAWELARRQHWVVTQTDGWRYHRTPARQARDNRRKQQHALAGRTAVRFGHYEIKFEAGRVEAVLKRLVHRVTGRKAA